MRPRSRSRVQQPHPPLLVGGSGTRGTAEPAARFADEYNTPFASPEDFARIRAKVESACERTGRTLRYSTMTGCLIGETRADALDRARQLYERIPRERELRRLARRLLRSARSSARSTEVAERLREYERAGCERVMLQHLLHADLEPVRLIGRLGQELV